MAMIHDSVNPIVSTPLVPPIIFLINIPVLNHSHIDILLAIGNIGNTTTIEQNNDQIPISIVLLYNLFI